MTNYPGDLVDLEAIADDSSDPLVAAYKEWATIADLAERARFYNEVVWPLHGH